MPRSGSRARSRCSCTEGSPPPSPPSRMRSPGFEQTLESRLATIVGRGDVARTIEHSPNSTIEPPRPSGSGAVAEALLAALAGAPGKFVLGETLGEGGMGIVHLATQQSLGRSVAVKTFRAGGHDPAWTLRLL